MISKMDYILPTIGVSLVELLLVIVALSFTSFSWTSAYIPPFLVSIYFLILSGNFFLIHVVVAVGNKVIFWIKP